MQEENGTSQGQSSEDNRSVIKTSFKPVCDALFLHFFFFPKMFTGFRTGTLEDVCKNASV